MEKVRRTKGIRKVIRVRVLGGTVPKYVTAGDRACRRMARPSRRAQRPTPSDSAILAWARFDLAREVIGGFWETKPAA